MIDSDIIYARIKRSEIAILAGEAYIEVVPIRVEKSIDSFSTENFFFMLYSSPDRWTAVSRNCIDYQNGASVNRICVSDACCQLHDYLFEYGKINSIEFIQLNKGSDSMWVGSTEVANALQNILNLLDRVK